MTVRDAVKISSNTVAIKTLAMLTPQVSFDFLTTKLGFTNSDDGLVYQKQVGDRTLTDVALAPLSMGGLTNGVSVREMATAYSVFPRGGTYLDSRTYYRVLDSKGNVLLDTNEDRVPVTAVKDTTAWYINSMLEDVVSTQRVSGNIATGYEGRSGQHDRGRQDRFHQLQPGPLVRGLHALLYRRRLVRLRPAGAHHLQGQPGSSDVDQGHEPGPRRTGEQGLPQAGRPD